MALTLLPHPDSLVWQDWLDTVVGYNADLTNRLAPDTEWSEFARRLLQFEPLAPPPEGFGDWRDWVRALKQARNV